MLRRAREFSKCFWTLGIVSIARKIRRDIQLQFALHKTDRCSGPSAVRCAAIAVRIRCRSFAYYLRVQLLRLLVICGSPSRIPLLLLQDCAIVVGACVVGFEFDGARIVSNCAVTVVSLRPGVGAIVVSGRICGAEFDCFGVVGDAPAVSFFSRLLEHGYSMARHLLD
jgi:hypothetical protein